ncbi:MAG: tat (twin-arginine translocation) pathway signal sequence [Castellaniella sp.]|nr:tat (twin-arginine translocation) pathway signal sequence [Castellaniella sp.]
MPHSPIQTPDQELPTIHARSRRQFLKGAIVLTGTLTAGSLLAALTPTRTWALEAKVLNKHQAQDLLLMAKRLYPHKDLPDAIYALLVKDIDQSCSTDPSVRDLVSAGLKSLNDQAGGHWAEIPIQQQTDVLKGMENTPFFQKVRSQCVTSLYDNPMAYKHFGYPGESWTKGGYIRRGFDDLTWLPDPPASASPSAFGS